MNPQLQEILKQLKDIHLPEEVSVFPLAVGWWLLLFFLLLLVVSILWLYFRNRTIRKQISELFKLKKEARSMAVMNLLKVSAQKIDRAKSNRLSGEMWTQWFAQNIGPISSKWQEWLSYNASKEMPLPKNWYKQLPKWLKKIKQYK